MPTLCRVSRKDRSRKSRYEESKAIGYMEDTRTALLPWPLTNSYPQGRNGEFQFCSQMSRVQKV